MADDTDIGDPRISKSASVLPVKSINSIPYIDYRQLSAALSAQAEVFYASAVGTGAALEITGLPFDPAEVEMINETTLATQRHLPTMAAATSFQEVAAGTRTLVGANGITLGAKGERKVTLGSAMHASADVLHVILIGSRGVGGSV